MNKKIKMKKVILNNGESIKYRDYGQGHVLVLLHGNMTSSYHLEAFIQSLPQDIRVIAPDMRGFGQSSYLRPINSLTELSNDINELLNQLDINQYSIAGWSMGGSVAIQHSIDYSSKVSHLILISSIGVKGYPLKSSAEQDDFLTCKKNINDDPLLTTVITALKNKDHTFIKDLWNSVVYNHNKPHKNEYNKLINDALSQVNIIDIYYALSYFNITNESNGVIDGNNIINKLHAPTLILHGENDLVIPVTTANYTYESLMRLNKPVFIHQYPQSGHSLFIDQPEQLKQQILTFIK